MKKFDWLPGACAPKYYPIEIYKGAFVFEDDNHIYIPDAPQLDNGWGSEGPTDVVGPDLKPIPVALELYWMSFAEQKWYRGSWQLPQEKMIKLFEQGFTRFSNYKKGGYDKIVAGMAPGGVVVVWIMGSNVTVEIARFQAEEAPWPSLKELTPDNPDMTREWYLTLDEEVATYLQENNIPFGLWDSYRVRYPWHPKVILNNSINDKMAYLQLPFYNGERYGYAHEEIHDIKFPEKAVPRTIIPIWEDDTKEYTCAISFNEATIFNSFKEFFEKTDKPAYLQVTITEDKVTEVYLINEDHKLTIEPEEIKRYVKHKETK